MTPRMHGADIETATRHGTAGDYRLATDVLAAIAQHIRADGEWVVDDYQAHSPHGRSWWIRFRRAAAKAVS